MSSKKYNFGRDFDSLFVVPDDLKKIQVLPPKVAYFQAVSASLDTNMKFVRNPSQKFRIDFEKMRRYSGSVLCDDRDRERGYSTVCTCGCKRLNGDNDSSPVMLVRGKDTGKLFFNGLIKCGSVWRCPVCSYKITQYRQDEIYYFSSEWMRQGGKISFVTLTMRHRVTHTLQHSLDLLLSEFRKLQNTKCYKKMETDHNIYGFIKTCEITFGFGNGWHPHLHLLVFHRSEDSDSLHYEFIKSWCKRKKVGALHKNQRAKSVYDGAGISEYVTKWDMTKEMTRSNFKESSSDEQRYTPFSILRKLTFNDFSDTSEGRCLKNVLEYKYREYCEATKGKHFISISKKLKKYFRDLTGQELKTDEEILENEKVDDVLVKIDSSLWDTFIKDKRVLPSYLINAYENGGIDMVLEFFSDVGYSVKAVNNYIYPDVQYKEFEVERGTPVYVYDLYKKEWLLRRLHSVLGSGVYAFENQNSLDGVYRFYENYTFENPFKNGK